MERLSRNRIIIITNHYYVQREVEKEMGQRARGVKALEKFKRNHL